ICITLLLLVLLELRLLHICVITNPTWRFDFVFFICVLLTLLSCAIAVLWVWPVYIDDHLNAEAPPNKISRRLFVAGFSVTALSVVLFRKTNAISAFYGRNKKRFRLRKKYRFKSMELATPGLYHRPMPNKMDRKPRQIVYFFNEESYSLVLKDVANQEQ